MTRRTPLMLQIVTGDPRPIARQIVDGIRRQIVAGELEVGAALPSVRGLAQQLAVNPNTVAKAYNELSAEGWLDTRAGLGVFIATPRQRLSESERARRLEEAVQRFIGDVIALDYPADEVLERISYELGKCVPRKTA
ncbi:MAG TPA: GntR family transcriptional regulator [Paucimonas sp.]|nr:GntR family transcriptional regulator [Paucimonas sp.]